MSGPFQRTSVTSTRCPGPTDGTTVSPGIPDRTVTPTQTRTRIYLVLHHSPLYRVLVFCSTVCPTEDRRSFGETVWTGVLLDDGKPSGTRCRRVVGSRGLLSPSEEHHSDSVSSRSVVFGFQVTPGLTDLGRAGTVRHVVKWTLSPIGRISVTPPSTSRGPCDGPTDDSRPKGAVSVTVNSSSRPRHRGEPRVAPRRSTAEHDDGW